MSCLDELKKDIHKEKETIQFAEIILTKKDTDEFMEDNPEYLRLRLKDPKIINVFL